MTDTAERYGAKQVSLLYIKGSRPKGIFGLLPFPILQYGCYFSKSGRASVRLFTYLLQRGMILSSLIPSLAS